MSAADHASHNAPQGSAPFSADLAGKALRAWERAAAFYVTSKQPNSRAGDLLATGFIVATGLYSLAVLVTAGLRLGNYI